MTRFSLALAVCLCLALPARHAASADAEVERELARVLQEVKRAPQPVPDPTRAALGSPDGPVVMQAWLDFNCGYCVIANRTMGQLARDYDGQVRIELRQLPVLTPASKVAARYMEAIALQDPNKALRFYETLFDQQRELRERGAALLPAVATKVGADMKRLDRDLSSPTVTKRIASDEAAARRLTCSGTPCFTINGAVVHGAYPIAFFRQVIDSIQAARSRAELDRSRAPRVDILGGGGSP